VAVVSAFSAARGPARFTEIEVERINVIEADGRSRWSSPTARGCRARSRPARSIP
jgi:hypothetical protein